jgi:hypothetical protein
MNKYLDNYKQGADYSERITESGNHFKNGVSPKSPKNRANLWGLMVLLLNLFCFQVFGQDGENPVIVQYRIVTDDAEVYTIPAGQEESEIIGNLLKGQIIPVDSLQIDDSGYLTVVIDYLDTEWAKALLKEYRDSEDYTGDLWYAYVKSACAEKVQAIADSTVADTVITNAIATDTIATATDAAGTTATDITATDTVAADTVATNTVAANTVAADTLSDEDVLIVTLLIIFVFIPLLILFFRLAAKSRKGKIIIYNTWLDVFLTLLIGCCSVHVMTDIHPIIGFLLVCLSFVWSCWMSIGYNKQKSKFTGIMIGIVRMLIIYLLVVAAITVICIIIASPVISFLLLKMREKALDDASQMRRRSEIKARKEKLKSARNAGLLAILMVSIGSIGLAAARWLMVSFVHSAQRKYT